MQKITPTKTSSVNDKPMSLDKEFFWSKQYSVTQKQIMLEQIFSIAGGKDPKTAQGGFPPAQELLGDLYKQGVEGLVEKNSVVAADWHYKASEQKQHFGKVKQILKQETTTAQRASARSFSDKRSHVAHSKTNSAFTSLPNLPMFGKGQPLPVAGQKTEFKSTQATIPKSEALFQQALYLYQIKDYDGTAKLLEQAIAIDGHSDAKIFLGSLLVRKDLPIRNPARGRELFQELHDKGHVSGTFNLARNVLLESSEPNEQRQGLQLLQNLADQGVYRAQFELASLFETGIPGILNQLISVALFWFGKAKETAQNSQDALRAHARMQVLSDSSQSENKPAPKTSPSVLPPASSNTKLTPSDQEIKATTALVRYQAHLKYQQAIGFYTQGNERFDKVLLNRAQTICEEIKADSDKAKLLLAVILFDLQTEENTARAMELCKAVHEAGHPLGTYYYAKLLLVKGTSAQQKQAITLINQAAGQGLIIAQHLLSLLRKTGVTGIINQSVAEAKKWDLQAMRSGNEELQAIKRDIEKYERKPHPGFAQLPPKLLPFAAIFSLVVFEPEVLGEPSESVAPTDALIFDFVTAIECNDQDRVKQLLSIKKSLANQSDARGRMPGVLAIKLNRPEILQLLITQGELHINSPNKNGYTLLMVAASLNNRKMIEMLLEAHAEVDTVDANGCTALMLAAENLSEQAIRTLLQNQPKPKVYIANTQGETSLIKALQSAHRDPDLAKIIVDLLLNVGAYLSDAEAEKFKLQKIPLTKWILDQSNALSEQHNKTLPTQPSSPQVQETPKTSKKHRRKPKSMRNHQQTSEEKKPEQQMTSTPPTVDTMFDLAQVAYNRRDFSQAKQRCQEVLATYKDHAPSKRLLAAVLVEVEQKYWEASLLLIEANLLQDIPVTYEALKPLWDATGTDSTKKNTLLDLLDVMAERSYLHHYHGHPAAQELLGDLCQIGVGDRIKLDLNHAHAYYERAANSATPNPRVQEKLAALLQPPVTTSSPKVVGTTPTISTPPKTNTRIRRIRPLLVLSNNSSHKSRVDFVSLARTPPSRPASALSADSSIQTPVISTDGSRPGSACSLSTNSEPEVPYQPPVSLSSSRPLSALSFDSATQTQDNSTNRARSDSACSFSTNSEPEVPYQMPVSPPSSRPPSALSFDSATQTEDNSTDGSRPSSNEMKSPIDKSQAKSDTTFPLDPIKFIAAVKSSVLDQLDFINKNPLHLFKLIEAGCFDNLAAFNPTFISLIKNLGFKITSEFNSPAFDSYIPFLKRLFSGSRLAHHFSVLNELNLLHSVLVKIISSNMIFSELPDQTQERYQWITNWLKPQLACMTNLDATQKLIRFKVIVITLATRRIWTEEKLDMTKALTQLTCRTDGIIQRLGINQIETLQEEIRQCVVSLNESIPKQQSASTPSFFPNPDQSPYFATYIVQPVYQVLYVTPLPPSPSPYPINFTT